MKSLSVSELVPYQKPLLLYNIRVQHLNSWQCYTYLYNKVMFISTYLTFIVNLSDSQHFVSMIFRLMKSSQSSAWLFMHMLGLSGRVWLLNGDIRAKFLLSSQSICIFSILLQFLVCVKLREELHGSTSKSFVFDLFSHFITEKCLSNGLFYRNTISNLSRQSVILRMKDAVLRSMSDGRTYSSVSHTTNASLVRE